MKAVALIPKEWSMTTLSLKSKKEFLDAALEAALKASKILLRYQKKLETLKPNYKEAQGLSSEADLSSERTIIKSLSKMYSDHRFLAEEDFYLQGEAGYDKYRQGYVWVIDPLDGTNNYLNGLPFYAISIALCYDGVPQVGGRL
jgi:myo-inositol-1(or 4)-monophosphatase